MKNVRPDDIKKVSPASSTIFWLGLVVVAVVLVVFGTVLFQSWQANETDALVVDREPAANNSESIDEVVRPDDKPPTDAGPANEHTAAKPVDPVEPPETFAIPDEVGPPEVVKQPEEDVAPSDVPAPKSADPEPDESTTPEPEEHGLATLTPMEVIGIRTENMPVHRRVSVAGDTYQDAIWCQPNVDRGTAQVSYTLAGKFAKLRGLAAIVDTNAIDDTPPSAIFRLYGDGNLLWESTKMSRFGAVEAFEVDVTDIVVVALVCESGAPIEHSRLAWANLVLTK